jgi:hypothetical protein
MPRLSPEDPRETRMEQTGMKRCARCRKYKAISFFGSSEWSSNYPRCDECLRKKRKAYKHLRSRERHNLP